MTTAPWIHSDAKTLAKALGITPRQLAAWRTAGAPVPDAGPVDELTVRLWHAGTPGLKAIAAPIGALAPYADGLASVADRAAQRKADDPAADLKRAQRKRQDILNAKDQQTLVKQGLAYVSARVGQIDQALNQRLTSPIALEDLRRAPDPAALSRKIKDAITAALVQALS